jgi:Protein of unknown function (DUF669)
MASLQGFDARTVEPAKAFDPLPAGKYLAAIIDSEMKPTRAGTGEYLQLTFEVLEGPHKGRRVWSRLNLVNPNAQAVKIGQAELSAVCRAVGVLAPSDSTDLHNLPLVIQVKCTKRKDTGEISNEVGGYLPREAQAPAQVPAPAVNGVPPWKRP